MLSLSDRAARLMLPNYTGRTYFLNNRQMWQPTLDEIADALAALIEGHPTEQSFLMLRMIICYNPVERCNRIFELIRAEQLNN